MYSMLALNDATTQELRGLLAMSYRGRDYSVYRLDDTKNVTIVSGTPLVPLLIAYPEKISTKNDIEGDAFDLLTYSFIGNNQGLELGDVLVEVGHYSDGGMYTIAQIKPAATTLLVRTEFMGSLLRPAEAASTPVNGVSLVPGWSGIQQATTATLTLTNGSYAFVQDASVPALIPVGITPQNRARGPHEPDLPSSASESRFTGYIPPLPGIIIQETDRIAVGNDTYVVAQTMNEPTVGLVGSIVILAKELQ